MTAKKSTKDYSVQAKLTLDTAINVTAPDLETALTKARELKVDDFVTVIGDHNDSDLSITGLFENN